MTATEEVLPPTSVPLELHLDVKDDHVDPVAKLTWCISRETIGWLANEGTAHPMLLIVVSKVVSEGVTDGEKFRKLKVTNHYVVPLDRGMQYVYFSSEGDNLVMASIVWSQGVSKSGKINWVLEAHSDHICDTPHGWNYEELGKRWSRKTRGSLYVNVVRHDHVAEMRVDVDSQLFAKEPPKWMKALHDVYYSKKPFDQCSFRRRMIVVFLTMPFLGVLYLLAAFLLYLGSRLLLLRGVRYWPVIRHPLDSEFYTLWSKCPSQVNNYSWYKDIWWLYRKPAEKFGVPEIRNPLMWLFNPWTIVGLWLVCWAWVGSEYGDVENSFFYGWKGWHYLLFSLSVHVGFLLFICLLAVIFYVCDTAVDAIRNRSHTPKQPRQPKPEEITKQSTRLEALTCSPDHVAPRAPTLVRLRAGSLKAKRCKPFPTSS